MSNNIHMCIYQSVSSFERVVSVINLFVSICMLVISIIGVVCVFNYHQHQREAVYGFYANLRTFLTGFLIYIRAGDNIPLPWMQILYKNNTETTQEDRITIEPIVEFCKKFFDFLSTAPNQIPPSKQKKKVEEWERSFSILRRRLVDIINYDLQAFPDWANSGTIYTELNDAVNNILKSIDLLQN